MVSPTTLSLSLCSTFFEVPLTYNLFKTFCSLLLFPVRDFFSLQASWLFSTGEGVSIPLCLAAALSAQQLCWKLQSPALTPLGGSGTFERQSPVGGLRVTEDMSSKELESMAATSLFPQELENLCVTRFQSNTLFFIS